MSCIKNLLIHITRYNDSEILKIVFLAKDQSIIGALYFFVIAYVPNNYTFCVIFVMVMSTSKTYTL